LVGLLVLRALKGARVTDAAHLNYDPPSLGCRVTSAQGPLFCSQKYSRPLSLSFLFLV
jgi:hypothetical protein